MTDCGFDKALSSVWRVLVDVIVRPSNAECAVYLSSSAKRFH